MFAADAGVTANVLHLNSLDAVRTFLLGERRLDRARAASGTFVPAVLRGSVAVPMPNRTARPSAARVVASGRATAKSQGIPI